MAERGIEYGASRARNGSQDLDTGAIPMARANNRGYLDAKLTASINWPIVAGIYPQLHFATDGLIHADQPWSGAYRLGQSAWVTAQTTEFTQPGWRFADTASGYLGGSRSNGSYVSYIAPGNSAWSTVAETVDATASQTLNLSVAGTLPGGTDHRAIRHLPAGQPQQRTSPPWCVADS